MQVAILEISGFITIAISEMILMFCLGDLIMLIFPIICHFCTMNLLNLD